MKIRKFQGIEFDLAATNR